MLADAIIKASRPAFGRTAISKLREAQAYLTGKERAPLPTIGGVSLDLATVADVRMAAGKKPLAFRTHDEGMVHLRPSHPRQPGRVQRQPA